MNKKKKKGIATLVMIGVGLLLLKMNSASGRAGMPSDFNTWYESNTMLFIISAISIVMIMIWWGFHEGRADKQIRLARETRKTYEAYGRIGGQR